jgi:hypothetical protein
VGECMHGLEAGMCALCDIVPPPGTSTKVWITWGGSHFHNDPDCPALNAGQEESVDRGDNVHPRRQVGWASIQMERTRCRTCVPRH